LARTNQALTGERYPCHLGGTWDVFWWSNGGFQGIIWIISATPPSQDNAYDQQTINLSLTSFSSSSFLPLWFLCLPYNFSKQPFNLFSFQISSMFFWLLFFLFWIIYKIIIIFQFHYPLIFLHLSYLDFILLIIIFLVFYPYPYPYLFYFSITSLVILFHLICIPDLIFIFLLLFLYFPDLFYFSISFLVVLFHLFFILDVVLVSFDCYLFCFLIFDDWEFCFVTFFRFALYGVTDLMTRVKFFEN
jgi:hypothetical protein